MCVCVCVCGCVCVCVYVCVFSLFLALLLIIIHCNYVAEARRRLSVRAMQNVERHIGFSLS